MAALDSALARGQRWSGMLDDLLSVRHGVPTRKRPRPRRDTQAKRPLPLVYTGIRTVARRPPIGEIDRLTVAAMRAADIARNRKPSPVPPSS